MEEDGGLTQAEAERRRSPGQGLRGSARAWPLLVRQFSNPVMIVLIVAASISLVVSDPIDGAIIIVIIAASGVLGFVQEYRAGVAMAELLGQVHIHADVLRDGREVEVLLEDVVVGDLVLLSAGDVVPGDLRIERSSSLLVDESSITGESTAVEKGLGLSFDREAAGLPADLLFLGSHVVSGSARARVLAVGVDTRFGSLVRRLESRDVRTRFEQEMGAFGLMLARVVIALVAVIGLISLALHRPVLEALMFALAVAVGITPQLLPAIVTVSLSIGAKRMARDQVLVKRLDAIEDIGGMTVLCCDKTRTLTAGSIRLDRALDLSGVESMRVLRLAATNAGLQSGHPNSLDQAILERISMPDATLVAEVPYDFERRRLSVLADLDGDRVLITKGAFTSVLSLCSRRRSGERLEGLTPQQRTMAMAQYEQLSEQGYRVLALATRTMSAASDAGVEDEADLVLEGLLAFLDPPTDDARTAVQNLRELGIELALVTGDNALVARHVADAVGLRADRVLSGSQLVGMTEEQVRLVVADVRVFAEVDPLQKERIVHAFQSAGAGVGFLGDGINDAAALRAADAGISVEGAADVAQHAAAIVVLTKDLDVIADGVRMGRATVGNTLKYIRVTISANFGNMVSLVLASAFLPFLPLLPVQILLLNLLSDVPALTIATDRVDGEEQARPREWDLHALRVFMIVFGLVSSLIDLSLFAIMTRAFDAEAPEFRSGWFVLSLLTECLALLVLRTGRPFWRSRPSGLLAMAAALVVVTGVALPFTALGALLGLQSLPWTLLGVAIGLAVAYVLLNEVAKAWWGRHRGWLCV